MTLFCAIRSHLVYAPVGHAGDQLLSLGTPGDTADLRAQRWSVGPRDELPLAQICHVQVAVARHEGAEVAELRHGVGRERTQSLAVGAQLEGGLRGAPRESVDIVHGQAAARLGGEDEVPLVGGKGELGDADGKGDGGLRGEGPDFAIAGLVGVEGLSHGLCGGNVDTVGTGGSDEALARGDAEQRGCGSRLGRPLRSQLDFGVAGQRQKAKALADVKTTRSAALSTAS